MLHVVDVRDAVNTERFVQVQFDASPETTNISAAGRALVSPAASESPTGSSFKCMHATHYKYPGSAVPSLATTPPPTLPVEMWSEPDPSTFRLRGSTYNQDKVKVASAPSMFKLLAVDLLEVPDTTRNIASHPRNRVFQALQRGDDTWVFVVNIMVSVVFSGFTY